MPMREELCIPEGHPLDRARFAKNAARGIFEDPDLTAILAYSVTGLLSTIYVALHFPLFDDICMLLMTID